MLTDNGKQFTGRFTKPRPAEVLFERVCREHGITAKLTKPYSPTTTGKVERWHQTLRRELLDPSGPFADLPSSAGGDHRLGARLQPCPAAPGAGHGHAGQLVPAGHPAQTRAWPCRSTASARSRRAGPGPVLLGAQSAGAVEFDTVISASGVLGVHPGGAADQDGPGPGRAARPRVGR